MFIAMQTYTDLPSDSVHGLMNSEGKCGNLTTVEFVTT